MPDTSFIDEDEEDEIEDVQIPDTFNEIDLDLNHAD